MLNDPYEGLILASPFTGAEARIPFEDVPVRMIRVGTMRHDMINPDYKPEARSLRMASQEEENERLKYVHSRLTAAIRDLGILSLSRVADSVVMWAHYASDSRGLCFGIDLERVALGHRDESGALTAKASVISVEYRVAPFSTRTQNFTDFVVEALGRKHSDWSFEREVRIVRPLSSFERHTDRTRRIGLVALAPTWVTEIVVGVTPDPEVRRLLNENFSAFPYAQLRQLSLDSRDYQSRLGNLRGPGEIKPLC
jgi:hypothetical protein